MNIRFVFVALALCGALAGCASVDGSFKKAFGEGDVISENYGGDPELFAAAAKEVREKNWRKKIDGPCASGCVIFADLARPNVCITDRAVFGFHKATTVRTFGRVSMQNWMRTSGSTSVQFEEDPPASPDIATWVTRRGGFPVENDFNRVLKMYAAEAVAFWPMCK